MSTRKMIGTGLLGILIGICVVILGFMITDREMEKTETKSLSYSEVLEYSLQQKGFDLDTVTYKIDVLDDEDFGGKAIRYYVFGKDGNCIIGGTMNYEYYESMMRNGL